MEVAITSNGTTLTKRARNIIDKLPNLKITLSIDSITKTTYESIRVNAEFEQVMTNIEYLKDTGKLASFSVCPIIQNRYEIPGILEYCSENGIDIFFNVVYEPLGDRVVGIHEGGVVEKELGQPAKPRKGLIPETSMKYLPVQELESLVNYYEGFTFSGRYQDRFDALIAQLDSWRKERSMGLHNTGVL
jgi:sulfatase maturation enzyme AslB (radical SAM superfamily)